MFKYNYGLECRVSDTEKRTVRFQIWELIPLGICLGKGCNKKEIPEVICTTVPLEFCFHFSSNVNLFHW